MAYSSIYNVDTSLKYSVKLNGDIIRRNVPPHHIEWIVYDLESQGINIVDELWDEESLVVELISTGILDDEEV